MRIIHSSDWHLGQSFFNQSRHKEHQQLIKWLSEQVMVHDVDAVILAGDIFDTGTPPSYARNLYSELILAMQAANCQLIITAGNHDSVATLSEIKDLVQALNCHVICQASEDLKQQIVTIKRDHETLGYVCAIPFLRSKDIVKSTAGENISDKQNNLSNAIYQHFESTFVAAQKKRQHQELPIIMTGHLTAVGATTSDSVREIYIGQISGINAHQLPAADYIALGHIHSAQKVGKQGHVYYSGSPIALSFDELSQPKSVNLISFAGQHVKQIDILTIPSFQSMLSIKGDLQEITQQLQTLENSDELVWLSIEVISDDYITDLQKTILQLTQGLPVEVLQLKRARQQINQLSQEKQESLAEITPLEVFEKRLAQEQFDSPEELARKNRLTQHFKQLLSNTQER